MAHLALYRKYRPTSFPELVGQPGVSRTLSRALEQDRLAHAYLFCGPRGTGKTSVARILARGINCEQGPTPTPCGRCASCVAVSESRHLDVVEIDAASHNGVDHVRELQDRVALAPAQGRRKVYIVDEVHMLSTGAFNALLKTLEEPPAHVVFVLATTDPHKVLPTIVSRCQRFDFGRIPLPDLVAHLTWVLEQEGLSAEADALDAIARRAQGGLRDALSLLDQVIAVAEGTRLGAAEVAAALGLADGRQVAALAVAVLKGEGEAALAIAQALQGAGQEATTLLRELAGAVRHALVLSLAPQQAQALEVPAAMVEALSPLAPQLSLAEGAWLTEALQEAENLLRRSPQAGPWLDLTLLRLAGRPPMASWQALQERVASLEARLEGRGGPSLAPTASPPATLAPPAHPRVTPPPLSPRPAASPPPAAAQATPAAAGQAMALEAPSPPPPSGAGARVALVGQEDVDLAPPEGWLEEGPAEPEPWGPPAELEPSPPTAAPASLPSHQPLPSAGPSPQAPPQAVAVGGLPEAWGQVMALLQEQHRPTAALLAQHASPLRMDEGVVVVKLAKTFQQMFERQANKRDLLAGAIAQVFGGAVASGANFRFVLDGEGGSPPPAPAPVVARPAPASPPAPGGGPHPTATPPQPPAVPAPSAAPSAPPFSPPPGPAPGPALGARPAPESPPRPAAPPLPAAEPASPSPLAGDGDEALRLAVQHFKGRVRRRLH